MTARDVVHEQIELIYLNYVALNKGELQTGEMLDFSPQSALECIRHFISVQAREDVRRDDIDVGHCI